jgi:OmpA-OmpF porin, OOP family
MKTIRYLIAASALSVFSAAAYPDNWYVMVSAGSAETKNTPAKIENDLAAAGATNIRSSSNDSNNGYKFQLGYKFSPYFALEGGYVNLGDYAFDAAFDSGTLKYDASIRGLNVSGVGMLPLGEQLALFGKLGIIGAKVDAVWIASDTLTSTSTRDTESKTEADLSYGLGIAYNFANDLSLRLEWEKFAKLGDKNTTGESDVNLVSLGLALNF